MTNDKAKDLGLRALALGMPWADGLLDGGKTDYNGDNQRSGCAYVEDVADYGGGAEMAAEWHHLTARSWPDFRDPVTEAWLNSWVVSEYAATVYPHSDYGWLASIMVDNDDMITHAETRAEAWILALEKLREEG